MLNFDNSFLPNLSHSTKLHICFKICFNAYLVLTNEASSFIAEYCCSNFVEICSTRNESFVWIGLNFGLQIYSISKLGPFHKFCSKQLNLISNIYLVREVLDYGKKKLNLFKTNLKCFFDSIIRCFSETIPRVLFEKVL
uniref:(northern house mosquito) hypothetical protein n=1 Tax=Culex pipiens TaxID=7175 RepID=A0A8D8CML3_CULPI